MYSRNDRTRDEIGQKFLKRKTEQISRSAMALDSNRQWRLQWRSNCQIYPQKEPLTITTNWVSMAIRSRICSFLAVKKNLFSFGSAWAYQTRAIWKAYAYLLAHIVTCNGIKLFANSKINQFIAERCTSNLFHGEIRSERRWQWN